MTRLFSTTKTFLVGGMFLGISYVVATTWGNFFTAYSKNVVNDIRCDKYRDKDPNQYSSCLKEDSTGLLFFSAVATTFVLALIALVIVWATGLKNVPDKPSVLGPP